jgi:hypothetical protein
VILRRDLIIDIHVAVEDWSQDWAEVEERPDDEFVDIIKSLAAIYCRCLPALRAQWPLAFGPEDCAFVADVKFGLGSRGEGKLDTAEFYGGIMVDVPVTIGDPDIICATASCDDLESPERRHSMMHQRFNEVGPVADDD